MLINDDFDFMTSEQRSFLEKLEKETKELEELCRRKKNGEKVDTRFVKDELSRMGLIDKNGRLRYPYDQAFSQ